MKRILVEVDERFHAALHRYARADRRTIRQIVILAVEEYMRQNPVMDNEYEKR